MPHPRPHPNSDAAGATRAVQEENAIDDEQFWEAMRDIGVSTAEGYKHLIASTEMKLKETERAASDAAEKVEVARERLAKLKQGKNVAGGLI